MRIVLAFALAGTSVIAPFSAMAGSFGPVDKSAAYERTVAVFQQQVAANPTDETAWLNLGMAYKALERTGEAHAALTRVTLLDNAVVQDRFGSDHWTRQMAREALATLPAATASMRQ